MGEFELKIKAGSISTNLDSLKAELSDISEQYKGVVITEKTVPDAKKDLARLRAIVKDIEDRRKSVKNEWNAPYKAFEAEVKAALEIINEPIEEIDKQIKEFAKQGKSLKEQHVRELYQQEVVDKGYEEYLPFASIFNEKWLNKSTPDSDIIFDLNGAVTKVRADMDAITALQSEFQDEIIEAYKASGNQLTAAIQRNSQLMSAKATAEKKVAEEIKAEEQKVEEQKAEEKKPASGRYATFTIGVKTEEEAEMIKQFLSFNEIIDYSVVY